MLHRENYLFRKDNYRFNATILSKFFELQRINCDIKELIKTSFSTSCRGYLVGGVFFYEYHTD